MRKKLLRWAPWNYRFWREIARWCYERSLHNPPVVPAQDHFPASAELHRNFAAIRQETLEVALSGRLPANHEIMEQQRTLTNSIARCGACCRCGAMAITTQPIRP